MVMRTALALLAAAAVLSGCGARSPADGGSGVDAPGMLVFNGLGSGSYLHAIRPDGSGVKEVELPKSCSPKDFTRDGRVLSCDEWTDTWGTYAVERRGGAWDRVPLPREWKFPPWVSRGMEFDEDFAIDAPEWAPAGDRIVLIRRPDAPYGDIWFSSTGNVVVADPGGSQQRVVAKDGEVPTWSPDGTRLAFARCRVSEADPTDEYAEDSAECSLWTVSADQASEPELLVEKTSSAPVWSPDGRFVAFFRDSGPCAAVCERRIFAVPAEGGEPRPVGPELIEASELFWLPDSPSAAALSVGDTTADGLELQRCADIWNRARMQYPTGVANVSMVEDRCRVTVAYRPRNAGVLYAGFDCSQPVPFSFQCPSHAGRLQQMNPQHRVWNAQVEKGGNLTLFDPPKGPRLPLPKPPPYPILNGYILPFGSDGKARPGLKFSETVDGNCDGAGSGDVLGDPDSVLCGWRHGSFTYMDRHCFKPPGEVGPGDIVLCSEGAGSTSFIRVRLSAVDQTP
jgi:hypothetical protein